MTFYKIFLWSIGVCGAGIILYTAVACQSDQFGATSVIEEPVRIRQSEELIYHQGSFADIEEMSSLLLTDPDPPYRSVVTSLPRRLWRAMQGRSYNNSCPVSMADLAYIRLFYRDNSYETQIGELVMHKDFAVRTALAFGTLYEERFPIERIRLPDHFSRSAVVDDHILERLNITSSLFCRASVTSTSTSRHAYGLAVDINPLYNPYALMQINSQEGDEFEHTDDEFRSAFLNFLRDGNTIISGGIPLGDALTQNLPAQQVINERTELFYLATSPTYEDRYTFIPLLGEPFFARDSSIPGLITHGDLVHEAFTQGVGWSWGGDWPGEFYFSVVDDINDINRIVLDFQHFEITDAEFENYAVE